MRRPEQCSREACRPEKTHLRHHQCARGHRFNCQVQEEQDPVGWAREHAQVSVTVLPANPPSEEEEGGIGQ